MKPLYQEGSFVVSSIEFSKFCIVTGYGAIVKTFVMLLSSSYCLLSKWVASIVLCFVVASLAPNTPFLQS